MSVGTRLLDFVDRLDRGSGVVLVVDEAHWADRPSLQAIIFALRRLVADRVLAVVALRDDRAADIPESLRRLIGGPQGTVLRLRGLDELDLHDLAESMGIRALGSHNARRLRYGTQGNPLHAKALLEEFPPSEWGVERADDDRPLPPPRSFRRLVQDRYAACSAAAQRLVDAVAVLDPRCPLPQAAALADIAEPLPALDEAITCDLLEAAQQDTPWRLSFPHPLVRSAVYDGMRPGRRHDLHLAASRLDVDEATALRHRVAAATEADDELAAGSDAVRRRARPPDRRFAAAQRISSPRAD